MISCRISLKKRSGTSHKGENGRVLAIGGSIDYVGAVYLAAEAAFRSGADCVTAVAPQKAAWALNCLSPDLVTVKTKGNYFTAGSVNKIARLSGNFDVVLLGNGIGRRPETMTFAAEVCKKVRGFKVIDADAIKAVKLQDLADSIITPHGQEFETLLSNSGCTEKNVKSKMGNNVILLKGATDKIVSRDKSTLNMTGHPGMTVAGTGDVLAGIAAGILAQEKDPWKAAAAAACVSGRIGARLGKKYGFGYKASDMLELIGKEVYRLHG